MPIRSKKNQYRGINAHLNSFLQNTPGEWESFHAAHVVDLARAIDDQLPAGYFARLEKSLQIREDADSQSKPRADQPFFGSSPTRKSTSPLAATATLSAPVLETMDIEYDDYLKGVGIYTAESGKPVTQIELLSPGNKPPSAGYVQYREKRNLTLRNGIPLVEIDYLHQTASPVKAIPSYPDKQPGALPYSITVSDPRPSLEQGTSKIYSFAVDDLMPLINIPLTGEETLPIDLGEVYNQTFERTRYYHAIVNYELKPLQFDSYTIDDQDHILRRMQAVVKAVQQGQNLARGPFPVEDKPQR